MIENFIFSANAVLPIFIVIALGYILRRRQIFSIKTANDMNRLVFSVALPVVLFRDIYRADFEAAFDIRLVIWGVAGTIICFILIWIFGEVYLRKRKDLIGAFVQAAFRPNYAIVGIPLVTNIMGGVDTGKASMVAVFVLTLYNIFTVLILVAKNPDAGAGAFNLGVAKNIMVGVCKTPAIIGIALGALFNLLNVPLPHIAHASIHLIAILTFPLALLGIGGSILVLELKPYLRPAVVGTVTKIIVAPIIFVGISVMLGFRGEALAVLFVMFANPAATVCYVTASRMGGNAPLTAAIIVFTTVFSAFTLTLGVYLMRTFELL